MYRLTFRFLPVLVAVVALTACGDELETPTAPTEPTITTETFSGTVTPRGAQSHAFSTQASGAVTATLKLLAPDPAVSMGMALGTWNGSSCSLVIAKTDAVQGTSITGAVSALGSLCVYIHDVGNLRAAAQYEIEVSHP